MSRTSKLLEIERKFTWTAAGLKLFRPGAGAAPFNLRSKTSTESFTDTYLDANDQLSSSGLWVRRRDYHRNDRPGLACSVWEAKQALPGSTFARSAFEETQKLEEITELIKKRLPDCKGPNELFGLGIMSKFKTTRKSFQANGRFTLVLDETDFGHSIGGRLN